MRSVFIIAIAVTFAAVLLIPVNDAFAADITTVEVNTFPFEITLVEEGTVIITSDIDRTLTINLYTLTILEIKAGEPYNFSIPPVMDSSNTDGWYFLDQTTGEYSIIHTVDPTPVTQLTINSLEIYEEGDYTRYHVIGDAPASTNLTFTMTKPDGSNGDYNGGGGTGQPSYNHDGLVSPNSDLVYGIWNLEICAAEHNMCVQESFTINQPASADTTPPTFSTFPPNITTYQEADVCRFFEFSNLNEWRASHTGYDDCEGTPGTETSVWLQVIVRASDNDAVTCTLDDGTDIPNQIDNKFTYNYDLGTHTVTCTASDISENTVTDSFTITVTEASADTTPPTFSTFPPNITTYQEADVCRFFEFSNLNEWRASHTGYDDCEGTPGTETSVWLQVIVRASDNDAVTCTLDDGTDIPNQIDNKFTYNYDLGTHTVTCTASDISENTVTDSFTITVTEASADTTPPTFSTFPPNITTYQEADVCRFFEFSNLNEWRASHTGYDDCEGTPGTETSVWLQVIVRASDNDAVTCTLDDGTDIPNQIDNKFTYNYDLGTHTVTCTASDISENTVTDSFTITVTDDTGNVPTSNPQSYTVLVNEMRGSVAANDPGGCASFNPQTCYTPSDITINVGDSVTWVNNDPTNNWYTLMGNWGSLASSSGDNACDGPGKLNLDMCGVSGNDRTNWTHTFDTVGTFNYHDWVYQNSAQRPEGVVNVVASGAPSPVTPATPTPATPTPATPTPATPTPSTNSTSTNSTSTNYTSITPVAPTTVAPTTVAPTTEITSTESITPSTNKITVQTNRETYSQGNPIVLFGKVSTVVDNDLILLKISKDGSVIDTQSFKPTSKGEYTKLVISSGNLWDSTGNYRVDASYDGATSTSNFYFTSTITSTNSTSTTPAAITTTPAAITTTPADSSKDLKISLNKENIKVGETITIRALLDSIISEQNVAVSVIDPNGKNVVSRTITVENSDQSSLQFKLVDNAISGTYIVKITSLMNGQTISDSAQFTVVSSISGVKIVSIEPTDQQGNTISTFVKNKMGFVKVVLSAENPINSLVTVNLFDSEFTSLGVGSFKTQLSGDHEIILSFFIPEFTTLGNGEIYTNVFSEWPSVGGIPLTGESSSTVILK